ncbi:MAG TPA: TetR family transcriptional regulator [Paenirhodobacter sp.]
MRQTGAKNDPHRAMRIAAAALVCIETHGAAQTTHRRIAAVAGLPVGSLTYHFASLDEIIEAAFRYLATSVSSRLADTLDAAQTTEDARQAVVAFLSEDSPRKTRETILSIELYSFAIRRPALQSLMRDWMQASRTALEKHFSPAQARALDALIEGVTLHNATQPMLLPRDEIADIVTRLTTPGPCP